MDDKFKEIWKTLGNLGFYILDVGTIDSKAIRNCMFEVKRKLSKFYPLGFYSMSRHDHQENTPFHNDVGPDFNILMLGYEPSKVKSKLFIGKDRTKFEFSFGENDHSFILLINNSEVNGVFHKSMVEKNPNEKRIVNSIMLHLGTDQVGIEQQQEFLTTDKII